MGNHSRTLPLTDPPPPVGQGRRDGGDSACKAQRLLLSTWTRAAGCPHPPSPGRPRGCARAWGTYPGPGSAATGLALRRFDATFNCTLLFNHRGHNGAGAVPWRRESGTVAPSAESGNRARRAPGENESVFKQRFQTPNYPKNGNPEAVPKLAVEFLGNSQQGDSDNH